MRPTRADTSAVAAAAAAISPSYTTTQCRLVATGCLLLCVPLIQRWRLGFSRWSAVQKSQEAFEWHIAVLANKNAASSATGATSAEQVEYIGIPGGLDIKNMSRLRNDDMDWAEHMLEFEHLVDTSTWKERGGL